MPIEIFELYNQVNARNPASKRILLDGTIEGHVLVKNINNTLPLKSPKLLSLFSYDAKALEQNNPRTELFQLWAEAYESINILELYSAFLGIPQPVPISQIAINGTIISGGGSGSNTPAYINAPFDAL
jgi:beta-glucosidase